VTGNDRDSDGSRPDVTETGKFVGGDRDRPPEPPSASAASIGSHVPTTMGDGAEEPVSRVGRSFADGDEIAGRYRVVKFLAQGGMGEVYDVEDAELGERVALKTILPRIAANPVALERFRREILFARKITHPNVCRIFDIGHHTLSDAEGDHITFLTMELLQGESLGKRLRRYGPMKPAEALPLVRQMTAGLDAAHQAGVVHRDLKPANIFLVPTDGELRAVVTDFGLARSEVAGEALKEVTGTGELLGTPSYMSPEQLEGAKPTPASDIYALGLIMYEMMTGARAFEGDTAFQMALKRLQEAPTAPRKHIPSIDPVWERTILHCLEKDPEDRFADVREVSRVLSGEMEAPTVSLMRRWRREARAVLGSSALWVAVAVIAVALGLVAVRGRKTGAPDDAATGRRSVAVLGFENVSRDPDASWISTALAEILTTELAAGGELRTIPGETVARARKDLGIEQMQSLGSETLERIRGNLGSSLVVLGSFTTAGERLRLDVRVQDAASGEVVIQEPRSGTRDQFFELAEALAATIRSGLGVTAAADGATAFASLIENPTAARLYSEGLEHLRSFDPQAARDLLLRAAAADPSSPLVFSGLATAWQELGYEREALQAAQTAFDLSGELGQEERTRIRGEYMVAARNWDEAIASFQSLWTFFPDQLRYGLAYAGAQVAGGRGEAALETVQQLRRLPAPNSEDPRIDLEEAAAFDILGRFEEQIEAANRAVERSRVRGARLLTAEARLEVASALINVGSYDEATAACEIALPIFEDSGNRMGVAATLERLALTAYYQGDFDIAEQRLVRALEISREVGNRQGEANNLNLLGAMQLERGEMGEAEQSFDAVLQISEQIESTEGEALALNNLALVLQRQGDLAGAIDRFQQSLALERERDNRSGEARALENIGGSYAAGGDLARARDNYEQAMGVYRRLESTSDLARVLYWLGEVLLWQGELVGARNRHQEALELRESTGERAEAASSALALAVVALQEAHLGRGSFAEVAPELNGIVTTLADLGWVEEQARAMSLLAEAELGRGRLEEAEAAVLGAIALADEGREIAGRMSIRVIRARLWSAQGRSDDALKVLRDALEEASATGILGLEFEVRLAAGEVELEAGLDGAGRARLESLRRDALARGWFLVSQRADRLLEPTR
jgi:tetratricopeptide (TPR) repeat protein